MTFSNVSLLRDMVRLLIGDDSDVPLYTDEQIDLALKSTVMMGQGPEDVTVDRAGNLTPPLETGDDLALLVLKAARYRIGGEESDMEYRTRALSVRNRGQRQRLLIRELEIYIHRIEGGECCFGQQKDFIRLVNDTAGGALFERWITYPTTDPMALVYQQCCCD